MARTYNQFYAILSAIKRCFSRSPTHREALDNAKCPRKKGPKGGARYRCASCRKDYSLRAVSVDHISPIVPIGILSRDMSWDTIVDNIFCEQTNLQVLCKDCHTKKSREENKERKKVKDELQETSETDS